MQGLVDMQSPTPTDRNQKLPQRRRRRPHFGAQKTFFGVLINSASHHPFLRALRHRQTQLGSHAAQSLKYRTLPFFVLFEYLVIIVIVDPPSKLSFPSSSFNSNLFRPAPAELQSCRNHSLTLSRINTPTNVDGCPVCSSRLQIWRTPLGTVFRL